MHESFRDWGIRVFPETRLNVSDLAVVECRAYRRFDIDLKSRKSSIRLLICFKGVGYVVDTTGNLAVTDPCRTQNSTCMIQKQRRSVGCSVETLDTSIRENLLV
jgi:hypothetical protein